MSVPKFAIRIFIEKDIVRYFPRINDAFSSNISNVPMVLDEDCIAELGIDDPRAGTVRVWITSQEESDDIPFCLAIITTPETCISSFMYISFDKELFERTSKALRDGTLVGRIPERLDDNSLQSGISRIIKELLDNKVASFYSYLASNFR